MGDSLFLYSRREYLFLDGKIHSVFMCFRHLCILVNVVGCVLWYCVKLYIKKKKKVVQNICMLGLNMGWKGKCVYVC